MANVSALLAQYQAVKAQISYYTLEQIKWQDLHDTMAEKVSTWQGYEEKWNDGSNDYCDKYDDNGKLEKKGTRWLWTSTASKSTSESQTKGEDGKFAKFDLSGAVWYAQYFDGNKVSKHKNGGYETGEFPGWGHFGIDQQAIAMSLANKMCPQFADHGSDKLEEYTNLDMEYSTMLTTMETMLTSLRAQEESLKTAVGEGAKDTGMGTGG